MNRPTTLRFEPLEQRLALATFAPFDNGFPTGITTGGDGDLYVQTIDNRITSAGLEIERWRPNPLAPLFGTELIDFEIERGIAVRPGYLESVTGAEASEIRTLLGSPLLGGDVLNLRPDGRLLAYRPAINNAELVTSINLLPWDTSAIHDARLGTINPSFSGLITPVSASYGDFSLVHDGQTTVMLGAAVSNGFPYLYRIRWDAGAIVEARVLMSTTSTNPFTGTTRGVAVNDAGVALTTLPIGPLGQDGGERLVGFTADFNPFTSLPTIFSPQTAVVSAGMAVDSLGNFVVSTRGAGSLVNGGPGLVSVARDFSSVTPIATFFGTTNNLPDVTVGRGDQVVYATVLAGLGGTDGSIDSFFYTPPFVLPNLRGAEFVVSPPTGSLGAGDTVTLQYRIQNTGGPTIAIPQTDFYLSTDATITPDDQLLASSEVRFETFPAGATTNALTIEVTLPEPGDAFWQGDGVYHLGMIVDGAGNLIESLETDNSNLGAPFDRLAVAINNTDPPPPLPGDYNCDDRVDVRDYTFWRSRFGATSGPALAADGNGDGRVDAADYTIWRDNLGAERSAIAALTNDADGDASVADTPKDEPRAIAIAEYRRESPLSLQLDESPPRQAGALVGRDDEAELLALAAALASYADQRDALGPLLVGEGGLGPAAVGGGVGGVAEGLVAVRSAGEVAGEGRQLDRLGEVLDRA